MSFGLIVGILFPGFNAFDWDFLSYFEVYPSMLLTLPLSPSVVVVISASVLERICGDKLSAACTLRTFYPQFYLVLFFDRIWFLCGFCKDISLSPLFCCLNTWPLDFERFSSRLLASILIYSHSSDYFFGTIVPFCFKLLTDSSILLIFWTSWRMHSSLSTIFRLSSEISPLFTSPSLTAASCCLSKLDWRVSSPNALTVLSGSFKFF